MVLWRTTTPSQQSSPLAGYLAVLESNLSFGRRRDLARTHLPRFADPAISLNLLRQVESVVDAFDDIEEWVADWRSERDFVDEATEMARTYVQELEDLRLGRLYPATRFQRPAGTTFDNLDSEQHLFALALGIARTAAEVAQVRYTSAQRAVARSNGQLASRVPDYIDALPPGELRLKYAALREAIPISIPSRAHDAIAELATANPSPNVALQRFVTAFGERVDMTSDLSPEEVDAIASMRVSEYSQFREVILHAHRHVVAQLDASAYTLGTYVLANLHDVGASVKDAPFSETEILRFWTPQPAQLGDRLTNWLIQTDIGLHVIGASFLGKTQLPQTKLFAVPAGHELSPPHTPVVCAEQRLAFLGAIEKRMSLVRTAISQIVDKPHELTHRASLVTFVGCASPYLGARAEEIKTDPSFYAGEVAEVIGDAFRGLETADSKLGLTLDVPSDLRLS